MLVGRCGENKGVLSERDLIDCHRLPSLVTKLLHKFYTDLRGELEDAGTKTQRKQSMLRNMTGENEVTREKNILPPAFGALRCISVPMRDKLRVNPRSAHHLEIGRRIAIVKGIA